MRLSHIVSTALIGLFAATGLNQASGADIKAINNWTIRSFVGSAETIKQLGATTVRVEVPWAEIQPARDEFRWSDLDALVAKATQNQVEVLLTLRSISQWGTKVKPKGGDILHGASHPILMSDWEHFLHLIASRYRGEAVDYEIENEVNADFWAGSLNDYLDLLKTSYRVIKSEAPAALVLPSAMACGITFDFKNTKTRDSFFSKGDDWLRAIFATRAFDVVNVHDYYFPMGSAVNGWTFNGYLSHINDLKAKAGLSSVPIWITETGYVSEPVRTGTRTDSGSADKQASELTQAYEQARKAGVDRVFWLFLPDMAQSNYFQYMGLTDANGGAKAAYQAFKDLSQN